MTQVYDILGLIGSFIIASALVPQIYKVYTTKSAADISRAFQLLYVLGLTLIVIYGVGEGLWPVYIPCALELAGGLLLMLMKIYYDRKEAETMSRSGTPTDEYHSPPLTPQAAGAAQV
ncbi:TPA: hypothetical protein N0F65_009619 [Lagenidium giganteum]|uniref:PQ loop repeat protein n=1 Tax=Lagenidium giganteum TaxID=4803 RepID=A0AAV2YUN0_9STRA|nr:TPA: hypothetical protein N0F65_009619 [Lagenidium giganteum]